MTITTFPITTREASATGNALVTAATPAAARAVLGASVVASPNTLVLRDNQGGLSTAGSNLDIDGTVFVENTATWDYASDNARALHRTELKLGTAATRNVNTTSDSLISVGALPSYLAQLPGPFADDAAATAAGVPLGNLYKAVGGDLRWNVNLDSDAVAYATLTSLPGPETVALSQHLQDLKAVAAEEDFTITHLVIGQDTYLSRSGATLRAVIGPDGEITDGDITPQAKGWLLATTSKLRVVNPDPTPTATGLTLLAIGSQSTKVDRASIFSGFANTTTDPGPQVNFGNPFNAGTDDTSVGGYASPTTSPETTRNISSLNPINHENLLVPLCLSFNANTKLTLHYGVQTRESSSAGGGPDATMYAGNTHYQYGRRVDNQRILQGHISYVMTASKGISYAGYLKVINSLMKHQICKFDATLLLNCVGSSISQFSPGVAPRDAWSAQLCFRGDPSNWSTPFYSTDSRGGTPMTDHELVWETIVKPRFNSMDAPQWKKVLSVECGRNEGVGSGPHSPTASVREALAERVIVLAQDAIANGVTPFVVTVFCELDQAASGANVELYNDYLVSRCAAEGIPFVDHRINSGGQFDAHVARDNTNFVDQIHLSALGYDRFINLCIKHKFPDPFLIS